MVSLLLDVLLSKRELLHTIVRSNLPNIMHVATKTARDIKEVCSTNMDV